MQNTVEVWEYIFGNGHVYSLSSRCFVLIFVRYFYLCVVFKINIIKTYIDAYRQKRVSSS